MGSQAILGTYDDDRLPDEATRSIEADVAFWHDPDEGKADEVDGSIGEYSPFHEQFGYLRPGRLRHHGSPARRLAGSRRPLRPGRREPSTAVCSRS